MNGIATQTLAGGSWSEVRTGNRVYSFFAPNEFGEILGPNCSQ